MLLEKVLFKKIIGPEEQDITGIHNDSRQIKPGFLFVCTKGANQDGHKYIKSAISKGAKAILIQDEQDEYISDISYILVPKTDRIASVLVDTFFESPTQKLKLIGVTGTNGKTTTTNLIDAIMIENKKKTGVIGTIEIRYGDMQEDAKLTTPLCYDLQHYFHKMVQSNVTHVAMEVSSHALDLGRVHGCQFSTAVFTNLTQDHLDYHQNMDSYGETKGLLFAQLGNDYGRSSFAVLNADDPWSEKYAKKTAAQIITYGVENQADVRATNIIMSADGTTFMLHTLRGEILLETQMIGKFNVYNMLAAASAAIAEGVELSVIKRALEKVQGVEGRFESVKNGQDFAVIVDYAHTPDSLENVLKTAKELTKNRVICVVGCGGDRDRTKRPIMGQIAANYADLCVFTSDNPRSENPQQILNDVTGTLPVQRYTALVDRKEAISYAISQANTGDCIVIAGKGHEKYQIIGKEKTHFDDKEVASEAIAGLANV